MSGFYTEADYENSMEHTSDVDNVMEIVEQSYRSQVDD